MEGEAQLGLCDSSKAWIFLSGLIGNVEITNKLESQKSCGPAEEIPKQLFLSFSCIFPHTLAAGEGLSASNHPPPKKKRNVLPRNERVACFSDNTPEAMISALMKTSVGLILSIGECVSHPPSVYSAWCDCTRVRRSEPQPIATALISFICNSSRNNSKNANSNSLCGALLPGQHRSRSHD